MNIRPFANHELPSFAESLVAIPNFLPDAEFHTLKQEIDGLTDITRTHVPLQRQAGTIAYETLQHHAPHAIALYQSPDYQKLISRIIGETVLPTPRNHPNSLSVLVYEKPGDRIGWHHDYNFFKGRYFTVLLALHNTGHGENGLSHARLLARQKTGDTVIPTPPNTLVLFEGSRVLHRATRLKEGERRIVLSMTYSTDPRLSRTKDLVRRIKDIGFFGLRALWT